MPITSFGGGMDYATSQRKTPFSNTSREQQTKPGPGATSQKVWSVLRRIETKEGPARVLVN